MLKKMGKVGLVAIVGSSMLAGQALALEGDNPVKSTDESSLQTQSVDAKTVDQLEQKSLQNVEGAFTYSQTCISTGEEIRRALGETAKYLCGSEFVPALVNKDISVFDWEVSVDGAVGNQFTASLGELAEDGKAQKIVGCSCAGNPAGGLGTVNVEVTGITMASIMERADVSDEANTIIFTSSDGYEVALPLTYAKYRYSVIVYAMNGESIQDLVGGSNQLWLGSTSAQYFAKDIVSITFENRAILPPTPGTDEAAEVYANIPGIGITWTGVQE